MKNNEYDGEIVEERGLVPYKSKIPQRIPTIQEAEYRDITEDEEETEALTSEQASRMTPDEIEDYRRMRAKDFARSLGVSVTQAQKMADSEIDSILEGAKTERGWKEERLEREKQWDEKSKEFSKRPVEDQEEDEEDEYEKEALLEAEKEKELWKGEGIKDAEPTKVTDKEPKKETEEPSIMEKLFGKKQVKTLQELKRERIYRTQEEHAERMAKAKGVGKYPKERYIRGKYIKEKPSLKDIGRGSMGTEQFFRPVSPVGRIGKVGTPDFFGSLSGMGMGNPMGEPIKVSKGKRISGDKRISKVRKASQIRAPSVSISFGGSTPPSVLIPFAGNKPPSVSMGMKTKLPSLSFGTGKLVNPMEDYTKITKKVVKPESTKKKVGKLGSVKVAKEKVEKKKSKKETADFLDLKGFF